MRRNILLLLTLCILCCSCNNSATSNVVSTKTSAPPQDTGFSLGPEDTTVLARVSNKTLDKIRKGQALDFSDVIHMQHSGIQSDTMIQVLLFTHSKFTLTTAEIIQLQSEGIPFKVINFMIRT